MLRILECARGFWQAREGASERERQPACNQIPKNWITNHIANAKRKEWKTDLIWCSKETRKMTIPFHSFYPRHESEITTNPTRKAVRLPRARRGEKEGRRRYGSPFASAWESGGTRMLLTARLDLRLVESLWKERTFCASLVVLIQCDARDWCLPSER
jgi:hypothetical protein